MENGKILDLSMLNDEMYANVRKDFDRWIAEGATGTYGMICDKDMERINTTLTEGANKIYATGICRGFVIGAVSYALYDLTIYCWKSWKECREFKKMVEAEKNKVNK